MRADGPPIDPSPSIDQAINAGLARHQAFVFPAGTMRKTTTANHVRKPAIPRIDRAQVGLLGCCHFKK
ncbi:hypothetical protein XH92_27500 [Bradyrhizobium sp. CCBAU 53421]|nr:hypothetical protein XH92_27500 [Bradyrhizobium sp. CCBAU 53421]